MGYSLSEKAVCFYSQRVEHVGVLKALNNVLNAILKKKMDYTGLFLSLRISSFPYLVLGGTNTLDIQKNFCRNL
jgi:hypothetical protein